MYFSAISANPRQSTISCQSVISFFSPEFLSVNDSDVAIEKEATTAPFSKRRFQGLSLNYQ
jgi:hypothetical protein